MFVTKPVWNLLYRAFLVASNLFTSLSFVEVVLDYGLGCQNVMALLVLHCTCTNILFVQLINFSDEQKDTGRQV